jgi:mono/diheme cytochrome c family protein
VNIKTINLLMVITISLFACNESLLPCGGNGQETYDLECATCHGAEGEGGSGSALKETPLVDSWVHVVRGGKGTMPSWGPDEIADEKLIGVLNFCITENDVDGQTTYQTMCANCHGFKPSKSGVVGPALAGMGRKKAWKATTLDGSEFGMPAFHQFLCEDDVNALVNFLVE